ncbi:MAG: DUF2207 domain-containing protein [Oscillospiraceae bacterium]|nr:DUF2207 domain-containing protein [Oscillospiraceae bacterium]
MLRLLRAVLLTVLLLVLLSAVAFADSPAVTSMTTQCEVENDGACTVTMRFTVEFVPGTESFQIPIAQGAKDIFCSAPYDLSSGDGCRLLTLTGILSGRTEITVSYRLAETVVDNGTSQEFSIQLLYPHWACSISGYDATIRLPGAFDALPTFYSGYHGDLIDNYMEISIDRGQVHAVLNAKQTLQDHEAMIMRLQLPKGFFDLRFLAGKTVKVDRLLFLGLLLMAAAYWAVFIRNAPIFPKRQAMPPEGGNAGEIPFILTDRAPDLALMIIQWASLGYLTLTRTHSGRIHLTRQMDMDTERKRFECEIFQTLFSRGDLCDVRSAEYLKARRLADEKPRAFWQNRVYDRKAGPTLILRLLALGAGLVLSLACFDAWVASKSWRWLAIIPLGLLGSAACHAIQELGGFLLRRHSLRTLCLAILSCAYLLLARKHGGLTTLMVLNLLAQLVVGLLLRCGGRRTKAGVAQAAELLGYRRWLLSAPEDLLQANIDTDPQFFYRILPFADALRVGRAVAVTLDQTRLEPCDWLIWEEKPSRTAPAFFARYDRLMAGLRGERDPGLRRKPAPARDQKISTRVNLPRRSASGSRTAGRPSRPDGRNGDRP